MRTPVLVSAVIATVAVAGVATAAIPGSDGAVIACYERPDAAKGGGAGPLRPVDSASDCAAGEDSVTLGARGPQGPPGPPGANGQTVSAEPAQVFENIFDGALPGGRLSSLPNSGDPFTIGIDVPAGTFVVLAQANMFGITSLTHHYPIGPPRTSLFGVEVFCTLAGGGQSNTTRNDVQYGSTWSQNLMITLTAPGRITMACKTPKFAPESRDDFQYASVNSLRLSATRLPQTRVTRTITLAATLAAIPSTTERRPPTVVRLEDVQAAQERQQLSAIARALRQTGH